MLRRIVTTVVVVLVLLVVVLGALGIRNTLINRNLRHESDAFVAAVIAGKGEDTYDMLSPGYQKITDHADWVQNIKGFGYAFKGRTAQYVTTEPSLKDKVVSYNVATANGDGIFVFQVVLSSTNILGTSWQVEHFDSTQN